MKTVTFRHYINHEVDSICQTDKFSDMPIVFLLVTDIDVNKNGIDNFNHNLNALASTSTVTYSECITKSRQTLNSEIYIQHDYICCKDFDEQLMKAKSLCKAWMVISWQKSTTNC